jgi:hypothetical protein
MKPDLYTKAVLTVIAVMLSVIAANQYAKPMPAHAASDDSTPTHFAVGSNGTIYLNQDGTNLVKVYQQNGEALNDIRLGARKP